MSDLYALRCGCGHWWPDHNDDDSCALCGCDWFTVGRVGTVGRVSRAMSSPFPNSKAVLGTVISSGAKNIIVTVISGSKNTISKATYGNEGAYEFTKRRVWVWRGAPWRWRGWPVRWSYTAYWRGSWSEDVNDQGDDEQDPNHRPDESTVHEGQDS